MKGVTLLKLLSKYVERNVLDLSYKMYVLPNLDYGDVIYHNSRTDLMDLIERVQYKAALIVSGCWQGTRKTKLYDELGLVSLSGRRWVRRLTLFYKIINGFATWYLSPHTRFSFYKNILYKNIEDEMGQKVKNILRICSSWTFAYKVKNTLS